MKPQQSQSSGRGKPYCITQTSSHAADLSVGPTIEAMKMTPDWLHQTLWFCGGIFGTGALWYCLSQKYYLATIWVVFFTIVFVLLAIALQIQNRVIYSQANTMFLDKKLIFKDSPFLTSKRKNQIMHGINNFRSYLQKLGFDIPAETPPIGTHPGNELVSTGIFPGDTILHQQILLPENSVDDPMWWSRAYAGYFFERLFDVHSGNTQNKTLTAWIFVDYFTSSFNNQKPKQKNMSDSWVDALWEIREACGQDFADQSLFFASRDTSSKKGEFNKYFLTFFTVGMAVIDNQFHNSYKVREILKKRKLL